MVVLTLKTTAERTRGADVTRGTQALYAPIKVGDFAELHTLTFKMRVCIEQAHGLRYVGRILDCRIEEFEGEEIEFEERHIFHSESPVTS